MSRSQRDKGARVEREIVTRFKAAGIDAEKVPLSGAVRYQGNGADIDVYLFGRAEQPWRCEVKARKDGAGFKVLEEWLGENELLILKRNQAEPFVCMAWAEFERLLTE